MTSGFSFAFVVGIWCPQHAENSPRTDFFQGNINPCSPPSERRCPGLFAVNPGGESPAGGAPVVLSRSALWVQRSVLSDPGPSDCGPSAVGLTCHCAHTVGLELRCLRSSNPPESSCENQREGRKASAPHVWPEDRVLEPLRGLRTKGFPWLPLSPPGAGDVRATRQGLSTPGLQQ